MRGGVGRLQRRLAAGESRADALDRPTSRLPPSRVGDQLGAMILDVLLGDVRAVAAVQSTLTRSAARFAAG